jgi:hypothetical protein
MKVINCQTLGDLCEFMLDGEPVFLIRAHDIAAEPAIKQYIEESTTLGGRNIGRSIDQLTRIRKWQKENPHKVRVAD